jgi:hypothetical protein
MRWGNQRITATVEIPPTTAVACSIDRMPTWVLTDRAIAGRVLVYPPMAMFSEVNLQAESRSRRALGP